eukprot:5506474-Lingulodinium_polyedra.AAC.1
MTLLAASSSLVLPEEHEDELAVDIGTPVLTTGFCLFELAVEFCLAFVGCGCSAPLAVDFDCVPAHTT